MCAHKIVTFTQTLLLSTISTVETSSDEDQNCEKTLKMSQQGAALQSYNNELVKCKYIYFYLLRDITLGPSTELYSILHFVSNEVDDRKVYKRKGIHVFINYIFDL